MYGCAQVLEDESLNEQEYEQHLSDLIREGNALTFAELYPVCDVISRLDMLRFCI